MDRYEIIEAISIDEGLDMDEISWNSISYYDLMENQECIFLWNGEIIDSVDIVLSIRVSDKYIFIENECCYYFFDKKAIEKYGVKYKVREKYD